MLLLAVIFKLYVDTSPAFDGSILKSLIVKAGTAALYVNNKELSDGSVWSKSTPS